jgi:hypothetical protein
VTPQRDAYGPDADALAAELTEDLEVLADRDPALLTPAEWDRAIRSHERLLVLGLLARRGRL